ncbi:hypothetical protein L580_2899 [Serratia fonticola AU-P3(3)]|nr:hypothetical protein L580_2899 [Serratia fonticola AU-P3(3)]
MITEKISDDDVSDVPPTGNKKPIRIPVIPATMTVTKKI